MRVYMKKLLKAFDEGKGFNYSSASVVGNVIFSYRTPIAKKQGKTILLNATKYSITTTLQQNAIREYASEKGLKVKEVTCNYNLLK